MESCAVARPPRPTTTAASDRASARCRPTARANVGASAPKTAKASTGNEVSRPAWAPVRPSPSRTSSSTGPTLTAAGRRLKERRTSPAITSAVRRRADIARSFHPAPRPVTFPGRGVGSGRMQGCGTSGTTSDGRVWRSARAWPRPVADTAAAARATVCLHATEPASVHLAAWARCGATRAEVDTALYDDRSVVKQLAMRRTVFAFPRELLPAAWASASARVAGQQVRRLATEMQGRRRQPGRHSLGRGAPGPGPEPRRDGGAADDRPAPGPPARHSMPG